MKLEIIFEQNKTLVRLEGASGSIQLEKIVPAQAPESLSDPDLEPESMVRKVDLKFIKSVPENTTEKVFNAIKNGSGEIADINKQCRFKSNEAYHHITKLIVARRVEKAGKGKYRAGWTTPTKDPMPDYESGRD